MDDKVIDSRMADSGAATRRRRECLACGRRYTTFERVEEAPLVVVKRSGIREPFDRAKILDGIRRAAKNRPISEDDIAALAAAVEDQVPRPRRVPAVRLGLQGLRGRHRLRAGGRSAAKDDHPQGDVARRLMTRGGRSSRLVFACKSANNRERLLTCRFTARTQLTFM
jgi:hypothetical protein